MVTIYLAVAVAFSLVFIYKFLKNQLCVKNIRMEMITATGRGWIHICPNTMYDVRLQLPFIYSFLKLFFFLHFFNFFLRYKYILAHFYQKVFSKMLNKLFPNGHLICMRISHRHCCDSIVLGQIRIMPSNIVHFYIDKLCTM